MGQEEAAVGVKDLHARNECGCVLSNYSDELNG
jgi:hypothetical protein